VIRASNTRQDPGRLELRDKVEKPCGPCVGYSQLGHRTGVEGETIGASSYRRKTKCARLCPAWPGNSARIPGASHQGESGTLSWIGCCLAGRPYLAHVRQPQHEQCERTRAAPHRRDTMSDINIFIRVTKHFDCNSDERSRPRA
jgi:hypothetical protein